MRPWARRSAVLTFALAAACAHQPPAPLLVSGGPTGNADLDAAAARATVNTFLDLEARGSEAADTLLAAGADFIVTGVRVSVPPRLAGLNGPGSVTIEDASTGLAGRFAWVEVGYRFSGRTSDLTEHARATFIMESERAGWRIRHVHSSMVERW